MEVGQASERAKVADDGDLLDVACAGLCPGRLGTGITG